MKIPAISGKIGNIVYYSTNLTFRQINDMVKRVDNELHNSTTLKEEIQRSLSSNYIKIKEYIVNRDDHFFNSLVLAVYAGEPKWTEIRYEIDGQSYQNVGLLEFNGDEKIFPVDGQHRVEGIKEALKIKPQLSNETISVVLIGHDTSSEGMKNSRRIFSTLNRYAKPVKLGDIIALDEDDIVAIVTRDLLENYQLFVNAKIKFSNSKSIPVNDKKSFTSLMTLYSCHYQLLSVYLERNHILKHSPTKLKEYLKTRPDEHIIEGYNNFLIDFWNQFIHHFYELNEYINSDLENPAEEFRSINNGGNLLFRPVSLLPFIEAISRILILNFNLNINDVLLRFNIVNRAINQDPWNKVIWDPIARKMIIKNQTILKYIFLFIYNPDLLTHKDKKQLFEKYALIHNLSVPEAENNLQHFVIR